VPEESFIHEQMDLGLGISDFDLDVDGFGYVDRIRDGESEHGTTDGAEQQQDRQ
jgi:hypothetical protein